MPRHKANPIRRSSSSRHRMKQEVDEAEESVLDDEEVLRLERELELLRREKAQHIKKMKENKRRRESSESSDSDAYRYESEDRQSENAPRESTRSLVNGIDKVQKRFRFNVRRITEKFVEREKSGLPESFVEMDNRGVFFFPERMAPVHQQNFVNKMFQRDAQFGKGSVSAPHNSIDSFDGDVRAMRSAKKLDERFGRKMSRNASSLAEQTLKTSTSSFRAPSHREEELDDDDVFDDVVDRRRRPGAQNSSRNPSSSTMASFFDEPSVEEEEDREFADDEEDSDENSEEASDEEEEEVTPIASRNATPTPPLLSKVPKIELKTEQVTPIRVIKKEPTPEPSEDRKRSEQIKEEPPTARIEVITLRNDRIETTPNLRRNRKITDFLRPIEQCAPRPASSERKTRSSGVLKEIPKIPETAKEKEKEAEVESPEPKPVRKRKPTEKMAEAMNQHHHHKHHDSSGSKKTKEPYCKHCELLKEEKKLGKQKKQAEEVVVVEEPKEKIQKKSRVSGKRRSAAVGAEEPEIKKKKLSDSDLISIPSSTTVVVDTELIAAENDLNAESLPKFADSASCSTSIWNTSVDSQLLTEMSQSRKSSKFFGVPLNNVAQNSRMINVWVDNLERAPRDKDTFSQDFRRALAQSKKTRSDGKAGYDIGRRST